MGGVAIAVCVHVLLEETYVTVAVTVAAVLVPVTPNDSVDRGICRIRFSQAVIANTTTRIMAVNLILFYIVSPFNTDAAVVGDSAPIKQISRLLAGFETVARHIQQSSK